MTPQLGNIRELFCAQKKNIHKKLQLQTIELLAICPSIFCHHFSCTAACGSLESHPAVLSKFSVSPWISGVEGISLLTRNGKVSCSTLTCRTGSAIPPPPAAPQGPFSTTNLGCHLPSWTPLPRWRSCLLRLVGSCWVLLGPRVPEAPTATTITTEGGAAWGPAAAAAAAVAVEALALVPACPPSLSYCR